MILACRAFCLQPNNSSVTKDYRLLQCKIYRTKNYGGNNLLGNAFYLFLLITKIRTFKSSSKAFLQFNQSPFTKMRVKGISKIEQPQLYQVCVAGVTCANFVQFLYQQHLNHNTVSIKSHPLDVMCVCVLLLFSKKKPNPKTTFKRDYENKVYDFITPIRRHETGPPVPPPVG